MQGEVVTRVMSRLKPRRGAPAEAGETLPAGYGGAAAAFLAVPQNGGYMVAAYIVAAIILAGYALSLYRRSR